jgi:hypothetical protein
MLLLTYLVIYKYKRQQYTSRNSQEICKMSTAMELYSSPNEGAFLSSNGHENENYSRGSAEVTPSDDFRWHQLAKQQEEKETNPVVSPYRRSEAREMFNEGNVRIEHRLVTMKNGTVYPVLSSRVLGVVPEGLKGLAHTEGVGWTTRPEGLYVERQKLLGNLAVEATTIGIPQNFGTFIDYDQYVDDVESILLREAIEYGRDPQASLASGLSQSAMLLMGLIVRGREVHHRETLAAHAAVLCLPKGITLKNWQGIPGEVIETVKKLPYELNAGRRLMKMDEEKRGALIPTADLAWSALYTQPQMLPSLLGGKSGEYAQQLPDDINVYAELKKKDALSRAEVWRSDEYLGQKPSVRIEFDEDGSHADVVSEISQSNWGGFVTAEIALLRENPSIRSNVTTAARNLLALTREQYPQYAKPLPIVPRPQAA